MYNGYPLEIAYFQPRELRELNKQQDQDKRAIQMKRDRDSF